MTRARRAWWVASWRGGALGDYDRGEEASAVLSSTPAERASCCRARRFGRSHERRVGAAALDGFARLDEVLAQAGEDRLVDVRRRSARAGFLAMASGPSKPSDVGARTRDRARLACRM